MNRLLKEAKSLEVFDIETTLTEFLKEKHGITASVHKFENKFNVFISNYSIPEERADSITKDLEKEIKKFEFCEDLHVGVIETKFGYSIILSPDPQKVKLMESEEVSFKCALCESEAVGHGHSTWPIGHSLFERCCDECNNEFILPARKEILESNERKLTEATRDALDHSTSNIVLDDKYIWLFSVLDENGKDIEEGIEYLRDAIDMVVKHDATFLVAFPYVDPSPEEESVDLVFVDNPGPVVIYDKEENEQPEGDE